MDIKNPFRQYLGKEYETIRYKLGSEGRLLNESKSVYERLYPKHKVFFNSCIFINKKQVWHGDVDFEIDSEKLQEISNILNLEIIVTPEHPHRFNGLDEEDKTIMRFKPNGK